MYVRRKVFSITVNENGEEKLFSTTELEQKEFGAHKRKQNRKLERALHNSEMHANRAAKAEAKAAKIVSNPANLVDESKMKEAQAAAVKAQKASAASKNSAQQAADITKKISKTRKSVNTEAGLTIKNQGSESINVKRNTNSGQVNAIRQSAPKSGKSNVKVSATPTNNVDAPKNSTIKNPKTGKPEAFVQSKTNVEVSTPKGKVNVSKVEAKAKTTENIAKVAEDTTKKTKGVFKSAKGLIKNNPKMAKGAAIGTAALALGGLGYKALKKKDA